MDDFLLCRTYFDADCIIGLLSCVVAIWATHSLILAFETQIKVVVIAMTIEEDFEVWLLAAVTIDYACCLSVTGRRCEKAQSNALPDKLEGIVLEDLQNIGGALVKTVNNQVGAFVLPK